MKAFTVLGLVLLTAVAVYAAPLPSVVPAPAVASLALATPAGQAADGADALASIFAPPGGSMPPASVPPALTGSTAAITCTHTQCAPCFTHHLRCGVDPAFGCVCLQ